MSNIAESNSGRFLAAYNAIDKVLRRRYGIAAQDGFSLAVRKAAGQNFAVKKYEDTLLEFARLRNAIVHGDTEEAIAEPHDSVVEELEKICAHISAPPLALKKIAKKEVVTIKAEASLRDAMFLITEKNHSHIPVIKNGAVAGIVNGKILTEAIARAYKSGTDIEGYLKTTAVEKIMPISYASRLFEILGSRATIEDAAGLFDKNRKLKLILITDTGSAQGRILGVATVADLVEFNNILSE